MDTVDLTTADYLEAFSTIDRSIRNLIDGGGCEPHRQPKKPPQLSIPHSEDDDATVAFLCSGLPHYEGMSGVDYSDLSVPLTDSTHDANSSDFEEPVPDTAWGEEHEADNSMAPLASPQTLAAATDEEDSRLAAYEGWIDFDALVNAVQDALAPSVGAREVACLSIGRRTETDYMLIYAVHSTESQSVESTRWVVQVPKPAVPACVFESEIVSVSYVAQSSDLPVPTVVAHDFSPSNAAGVPYAVLTHTGGTPLGMMWPALEARQKRRILDHIADAVVKMSQIRLPLIGSLVPCDGELIVGPLLCARDTEPGYAGAGGPFQSTRTYLDALLQASSDALGQLPLLLGDNLTDDMSCTEIDTYRTNVDRFVEPKYDEGPFVLMPESLDMHHFLMDPETLRLVGVVDWTYSSVRPLQSLVQPPPFTFDDTPRWEPHSLGARVAHRRNLIRYRQWFMRGLQKRAWAVLGSSDEADELSTLVRFGYWRYKFEHEAAESIRYSNPWSFRALWEHLHPDQEFAVWLCELGQ
ncbi:hypothetical protein IW140_005362 [Coemansia sp. RSA 1813]|nr:hypothetical protein EV178_005157 [Coemansia sp. RSA 1646]KAJ1769063.1 hypothetical protein LPJ74_004359 [Coemansia sp. RSA 1843]KAJ2211677.1 hypothetical protein EV179_005293 [Coemansia sp. RSA 487]KAJ2565370.1 hypothetical protein IW140_005362 [Coemansia sp. RSA 1813]